MPKRQRAADEPADAAPAADDAVLAVRHRGKRKNIPPAGLEAQGRVAEAPRLRFAYNPHLTQALRRHEPWPERAGKRERPWFEVEPPALHIHERMSAQAMLRVLAREDVEPDLFADPQQSYSEAAQFYQHDIDGSNRMILSDSPAVMASQARREDVAGKVQMIYIDPPHGISFKNNVQPAPGQRDAEDRAQDLTREPEMVKAYRGTWTLGIHSYLAYLRDRLMMARESLTDSGSVFVQISDENMHRVQCVMDDVLGAENFVGVISFKTTTKGSGDLLATVDDFLIWYARDKPKIKFNDVYLPKDDEPDNIYKYLEFPDGHELTLGASHADSLDEMRERSRLFSTGNITSSRPAGEGDLKSYEFRGVDYPVTKGTFKSDGPGLKRLELANRLGATVSTLRYKRMFLDFAVTPIGNMWVDTSTGSFTESKTYVVQTSSKVVERCLLMTTDPGDLALDPTCGSGTTAFVAEKRGRRWITIDSSRVALALAEHRLMTASFEHFKLCPLSPEDLQRNPRVTWLRNGWPEPKTFHCKTVPHITLKSIARNTSLDPIFTRHEPVLVEKLAALNQALGKATPELKVRLEDAVRAANRAGYDEVVFAGFGFDAAAQAAIDEATHPRSRLHMALIRPDVAMGDLLETQPGNQLFMVFSGPRVRTLQRLPDGQFCIEVEGMDVYDTVSNSLFPTSRDRIAAWFVDTDYDGRTFCICQAFFPDRKKRDKLARALGDRGEVDEGRFDALAGFESLPFARPDRLPARAPWRVGVKVIDPRGNEGLRALTMPE